jgi:hypothetical protein
MSLKTAFPHEIKMTRFENRAAKLLVIGATSHDYEVGSMLLRAAKELRINTINCNTNLNAYAPSMRTIHGKIFYRLSKKKPLEWWNFNEQIVDAIMHFQPNVILSLGIFPLSNKIFSLAKEKKTVIVNFLTDDPWSRRLLKPDFIENIKYYDLIISTKRRVIPDLKSCGAKRVEFMYYAFDPYWHHLPKSNHDAYSADISFIGTGCADRLPELRALSCEAKNLNLNLYGNGWERIEVSGWKKGPAVTGEAFRLAMFSSKLSLCLLRKSSRDDSTQRTFEISPCGGCGMYEDTPEHREVLSGYPEYGFFRNPSDLAEKCIWLLKHSEEREQMRKIGMDIIANPQHTFSARLVKIFNWLDEIYEY